MVGTIRHRWLLGRIALIAGVFASSGMSAQEPTLRQTIDSEVSAGWQREKLAPADATTDAQFLRRAFLDLVGVIPEYEETIAFLKDISPDKRSMLIDRLLDDPRYAQHQADIWDLTLFGRVPLGDGTSKRDGIQRRLRDQFAGNRPYNAWVRELLRAEGNSVEQGPPLYFVQYRNQPEDLTEVVTQTFLGVQLQCARCHDHPFDRWTQTDFFGMAAYFVRLEVADVGKKDNTTMYAIREKSTGDVLFTGPAKDQKPGQKGTPVKPRVLLGDELAEPPLPVGFQEPKIEKEKPIPAPLFSRRDQLVDWMTQSNNPYFCAIANRIWAQYLGHGLVHPIDNLSPKNAPSHPALLEALSKWLVERNFDLKAFTRELLNSRTYQVSSSGSTGEAQPIWFQHARSRPLSAEELVESWRVATSFEAAMKGKTTAKPGSRFRPLEGGYVLQFLGQPNNGVGDFQGGLAEHLYLNNGPLGGLLSPSPGGLLAELNDARKSWDARVERLFVQVLNRPPDAQEQEHFVALFSAEKDPQERLRDAIWALMTCSEFRFNH